MFNSMIQKELFNFVRLSWIFIDFFLRFIYLLGGRGRGKGRDFSSRLTT